MKHPNTPTWRAPLASVLVAGLALAACSGGDDTADTTVAATAPDTTVAPTTAATTVPGSTVASTSAPATTVPDVLRMPLTGEPIEDASEIPDRPALVVKVPTYPSSARPQAGLNKADIVFETIINDNVTRLIAVFHSDGTGENPVGPIRSGRAQDISLLAMLNTPLMAWSGGNASVTRAFEDAAAAGTLVSLNHVRGSTDLYFRRSGKSSPNNLYSNTDLLWSAAPDDAEPPHTVFPYLTPGTEPTGDPAEVIDVMLDSTDVRWEYDAETGTYLRWQDGSQHNTEDSGQVVADNVVVMLMDYGVNRFDGNPDMQAYGSNPVLIFSKGTVRTGVWLRFGPDDGYGFYDNVEDLNELGLTPGNTWVEFPRNQAGVVTVDGEAFVPGTTPETAPTSAP